MMIALVTGICVVVLLAIIGIGLAMMTLGKISALVKATMALGDALRDMSKEMSLSYDVLVAIAKHVDLATRKGVLAEEALAITTERARSLQKDVADIKKLAQYQGEVLQGVAALGLNTNQVVRVAAMGGLGASWKDETKH